MTRSALIVLLAKNFPTLTAKDAEIAAKEIVDAIGEALVRGDLVEIWGIWCVLSAPASAPDCQKS